MVGSFNEDSIMVSDIEFVSEYSTAASVSHFRKGNKIIKPNPWRRYGSVNPVLYLYYELYNIPLSKGDSLLIYYQVVADDGNIIKSFPKSSLVISGNSTSVLHGMTVHNVPSGIYSLKIILRNPENKLLASVRRQFEIIQPDYLLGVYSDNEFIQISRNVLSLLTSSSKIISL